jgi:serine/threonine-protein kinase
VTIGAVAVAFASGGLAIAAARRDASAGDTLTFQLHTPEAPDGVSLQPGPTPVSVSPDGRQYVYRVRNADGAPQLVLRPASDPIGRWMPGTENAVNLAFSLDGSSLAFTTTVSGPLMRVSLSGGSPTRVAGGGGVAGLAWAEGGFVLGRSLGPLEFMAPGGAEPIAITVRDSAAGETSHRFPVLLPDGEHVAFTAFRDRARSRIGIVSLKTRAETRLDIDALAAVGYAGGYLILHDGRAGLVGLPFDVKSSRLTGSPVALVDSVSFGTSGVVRAALSSSGTLIYLKGSATDLERELVAIAPDGSERSLTSIRRIYSTPRYAPNGRRVAVEIQGDSASGIWMLDLGAGTIAPATRGYWASRPEWSPDGRDIAFMARVGAARELRRQPADGTAPARLVLATDDRGQPVQILFSRDARHFVYRTGFRPGGQRDALWYRAWDGDTTVRPVAADSGVINRNPAISPDGKWIAYESDESGTFQVYVRPFPGPGPRYAVTVDGGESPVWSPDGRKLYYVNGPLFEEAAVRFAPEISVTRRPLFQHRAVMQDWTRNYDIAPDGSHFIFVRNPAGGQVRTGDVVVIHNWAAQLEARRSGGKE